MSGFEFKNNLTILSMKRMWKNIALQYITNTIINKKNTKPDKVLLNQIKNKLNNTKLKHIKVANLNTVLQHEI